MIPLRLTIRNFLCYRDSLPPLDFAPVHQVGVACLCGDNGHGKSALLDAITWALWGKARARSDDELIHMGQTEAEVELEFLAGDTHYRVIRKRQKGGSRRPGQTSLELQVKTPSGFLPCTGDSVRETERRIIEILRMDYNTFINTAFLLQGRADEFTTASPADRKEVLASILGLDVFERVTERARELARERQRLYDDLEAAMRYLDEQLVNRPHYEAQLREAEQEIADLSERAKEHEEALAALRSAKHVLDLQEERLEKVRQEADQARDQLSRLETAAQQHRQRIAQYQEILAQAEDVRQGYQRLIDAREQERTLGNLARQVQALEGERMRWQRLVDEERHRLIRDEEQAQRELARLDPLVEFIPQLQEEHDQVQKELTRLQEDEKQVSRLRQQAQEAQLKAQSLISANENLRTEIQDLERRETELAGAGARCPLCGQPLEADEKEHIQQRYRQDRQAKADLIAANEQQARDLTSQAAALERQADALAVEVNRRQGLTRRKAELERDIETARMAEERSPALREELAAVQVRLAAQDYAPQERERLAEAGARIAALGYDPDRHAAVQQEREALERYDQLYRRLGEAERLLEQEERSLASALENQQGWQKRLEGAREEARKLEEELASYPDLDRQLEVALKRWEELERRRRELGQLVGALYQKIEGCALLEKQKAAKEMACRQAQLERGIYEELATAFGKNGIQAMLIDAFLPEIQNEANHLLSRMTNGRMTVTMSTQRTTQKGTTAETLDIKIADDLGTRSYEMFSGGEAFRINFALRVALAKFLAHRAGAPLPTLIIDEGFGTLDSAGRDGLVAAINAVQPDFRCILVITHIDELRDAFPIRIEVYKRATGSTFQLVEG